jgi:hypothetical protein
MPRRENDQRTPYQKATARRVQRGQDLVEKMKAELYHVERALGSGNYLYTTGIGEMAVRLQATLAELEALEEMHDDAGAVAALAGDRMELTPEQNSLLRRLAHSEHGAIWLLTHKSPPVVSQELIQVYEDLAAKGLVKETTYGDSRGRYFEITDAGRELAGRP